MDSDISLVSVDKIIEKSKQWTLEGDCTLLQWMNQISKNLEDRVNKTNSALNEMSTKLNRTSVALSNVTNNLAALQYSQFVENRVHDDDETLANVRDVPNVGTDVTDNKDANHNIYSFLKKNLEMMNSCHEAYSISYDDSDEDEPATNVVYRSKNPYEARSLPHIYGSKLWKEKWHIGLCDSDNDFSGDEESEQFSESSSTADDSYESTAPTMSEWDSTAWGLNTNHLPDRKETHTPSNDGESSYQGENSSQSEVSTPRAAQRNPPIAQPIPEQRYYQHVQRNTESNYHDIFTDSEQQAVPKFVAPPPAQKKISPPSLIANEPPPDADPVESDNNRRIGAKKPLNLFDDDEFSSFMDQIVKTANNKGARGGNTSQEPTKKAVVPNLFDDSSDTAQTATISNAKDGSLREEPPKKATVPNLFDDYEGIGGSLPKEPQKKAVAPNLFNDSEDIFTPKVSESFAARKNDEPKLKDDIFMPPTMPKVASKIKTKNLFDDDDDDDDFEKIFASKPSKSIKFTAKTKNLFDDVLGDLEGGTQTANQDPGNKVKEAVVKEVALLRKGLFDDNADDLQMEKDVYASKPAKKNDLFQDAFNKRTKDVPVLENDLFGDQEAIGSVSNKGRDLFSKNDPIENISGLKSNLFSDIDHDTVESVSSPDAMESKAMTIPKIDLFADVFQDEPPEDIFAPSSEKKKTKVADIFADNFADDFEEFVPKRETTKAGDMPVDTKDISTDNISQNQEANVIQKPAISVEVDNQKEIKLPSAFTSTKIKVVDLFADEPTEDFEEFISELGTSKSKDVAEDKDVTLIEDVSQNRDATSEVKSTTKLPAIARKPSVTINKGAAASSAKMKATANDIFTDDFADSYEEFIPKLEARKANQVVAENVEASLDDIAQNRDVTRVEVKPSTGEGKSSTADGKPSTAEGKRLTAEVKPSSAEGPLTTEAKPTTAEVKPTTSDMKPTTSEVKPTTSKVKPTTSKVKSTTAEVKPIPAKFKPITATKLPDIARKQTDPTIDVKTQAEITPASEKYFKPAEAVVTEKLKKNNTFSSQSEDTPATESLPTTTVQASSETTPEIGKQAAVPSYTSLFHDEPPPDDDDSFAPSFEEPPVDDDGLVAAPPAAPYNSINLFADVPPDDDFPIVPPTKTKRIHSIFYDDFNETIEASREMRTPSSYIFNDEPPPDDDDAHSSKVIPKEEPKVVKERPKVSKLKKTDLQINVGALLPTAKAPSFKKPEASISIPPKEDNKPRAVPTVKPPEKRDLPENILPNLNRDRAKVQVKRRPSTRRGRQESYRKSMIEEEVVVAADGGSNEDGPQQSKEAFKKPKSLFEDFGAFDIKKPNLSEIIPKEEGFQTRTSVKQVPEGTSDNLDKNSEPLAKIPSLFEDSNTDTGNIFETLRSNKEQPKPSQPEVPSAAKIIDSLFDSDGVDENPFGTPTKINDTPPQSTAKTQVPSKSIPSPSLFEESDSVEEKQPVTAPPTRTLTKNAFKFPEEPTKPPPKPTSLFGESDDGSDDLFKESKIAKKPTPQKTIEKKPKPKPVSQPVKPATSLFSSDEESGSGDDIFGKPKPKATPKKVESAKAKPSSSLFADLSDDDDDDLFGATKKKHSGAGKIISKPSTTKTPPAKTSALAQQQTPISNNPLSDLLGP